VKNKIVLLSILASLSQAVSASESPEQVGLLKKQIKQLTERLDKLESESKVVENAPKPTQKAAKKSYADRLSFKADFREHYEIIDQEGKEWSNI
jgi:predicted NACHT family NTPase